MSSTETTAVRVRGHFQIPTDEGIIDLRIALGQVLSGQEKLLDQFRFVPRSDKPTTAEARQLLEKFSMRVSKSDANLKRVGDLEIDFRNRNPILAVLPFDLMLAGEITTVGRALMREGISTPDQFLALDELTALHIRTIGHKRWQIISAMQVLMQDALQQEQE